MVRILFYGPKTCCSSLMSMKLEICALRRVEEFGLQDCKKETNSSLKDKRMALTLV